MRILITGGNGYVGRALTRSLYLDHEVSVVDNFSRTTLRFSEAEAGCLRLFRTDIRDHEALQAVFDEVRPEIVLHLAALHYIPECDTHPDEAIAINVLGTANVVRCSPEGARFVLISTAAVYAPQETPHCEDQSPVGPMDVYGLTKLHAEDYVRYWSRLRRLRTTIIRLFNVIGPGETNPHILPAIIAQLKQGNRTLRLGNCYPKRDYIDVEDVASAVRAVAFAKVDGPCVDVVNLGTGTSSSVYEIVDLLSEVIGEELTIETDVSRTRASDRPILSANTDKMRRRFGWEAKIDLRTSLETLWSDPDIDAEILERS